MGTPAIVQFCDESGAIDAQLYVHHDGGDVPEWIGELLHEHKRRNHYATPQNPSTFATAFVVWRYDQMRTRYSMGLFEALGYTPRPTLNNYAAAYLWRVTVFAEGQRDPVVEQVEGHLSVDLLAESAATVVGRVER